MGKVSRKIDFYTKFLQANVSTLGKPIKLNYAVTYDCNLRCEKCNIWKKEPENELELDEIRRFFRENDHFRWVSLTGGEPFLRDDIDEIARVIEEESRNLYVLNSPTNGALPGKAREKAEEIASLDVPNIILTVSIDGPEEVHDSERGIEGSWKKAVETYRLLDRLSEKEENFKTLFSYTVSGNNLGEFGRTVKEVDRELASRDVDYQDFGVNFQHGSGHYYEKEGLRSRKFFEEVEEVNRLKDHLPRNLRQLVSQLGLKLSRRELRENRIPCVASEVSAFMNPRGVIYPCIIHDQEIGDVREYGFDLEEMWDEQVQGDYRKYSRTCGGCWLPCESNQAIMANMPLSIWEFLKMKVSKT
ncbi:MAG: radical SAM protein [Candidatus Nanohaloarchaea archaeon]